MERLRKVNKWSVMLFFAFLLAILLYRPVQAASVKISRESCTISIGETYQLSVTVDGNEKSATWKSSNKSVATVNSKGKVTGKAAGSAVIRATVSGQTVECLVSVLKKSETTTYRYNVLILDTSGSMSGKPMTGEKSAALRFCKKVLSTSGKNYVAIVTLNSSSSVSCNFTDSYSTLSNAINSTYASGGTNMNAALSTAGSLLENVSKSGSNVMKNIILCSDGLPERGLSSRTGRYSSSDHSYDYSYANVAYTTASGLKNKGYFIYALGFFHSSTGKDLTFGKKLMKDLASKDKYYIIQDTADLDDVYDTIADTITKTTINKSSVTLKAGETCQLYAYVNGQKKSASWSSSKTSVATVNSSGKVTGKTVGTATITGKVNGNKVTCKVTVKSSVTLKLNKSKATLSVGEKMKLKATLKNSNTKVYWKSSNTSVAAVTQSGVVTAKKAGTAVISAAADGITKKCKVTVKKAEHPLYSIYFKFSKKKLEGTSKYVTEYGNRIVLNDSAVIEKCGAYIKKTGSYYYVTMAFTGSNVTSAVFSPYVAYNGKMLYDGATNSYISSTGGYLRKFSMSKNSKGVWSVYGSYETTRKDLTDSDGNLISKVFAGVQSENTRVFTDLSKMKKWLES